MTSGAGAGKVGSVCAPALSHPSGANVGKALDSSELQFPSSWQLRCKGMKNGDTICEMLCMAPA